MTAYPSDQHCPRCQYPVPLGAATCSNCGMAFTSGAYPSPLLGSGNAYGALLEVMEGATPASLTPSPAAPIAQTALPACRRRSTRLVQMAGERPSPSSQAFPSTRLYTTPVHIPTLAAKPRILAQRLLNLATGHMMGFLLVFWFPQRHPRKGQPATRQGLLIATIARWCWPC